MSLILNQNPTTKLNCRNMYKYKKKSNHSTAPVLSLSRYFPKLYFSQAAILPPQMCDNFTYHKNRFTSATLLQQDEIHYFFENMFFFGSKFTLDQNYLQHFPCRTNQNFIKSLPNIQ